MSKEQSQHEFPEEIITNIISRLPAKTLLQCKSVSKFWLSLISNPRFAKLHLQQMKENDSATRGIISPVLLSFNPEECFDDTGDYNHQKVTLTKHCLPNMELQGRLPFIVDSCNGLICISDYRCRHFVVYNPATRQIRKLPKWDSSDEGITDFCGFGYDSKIDDYKIVKGVLFPADKACTEISIEIFNLKSNSWRTVLDHHLHRTEIFDVHEGVFLNGVLHWLRSGNFDDCEAKYFHNFEILRFDLVEERFLDPIRLPSQLDKADRHKSLIVIDECLCVFLPYHSKFNPRYAEAWKMINYGVQDSWTRIYHFSDDDLINDTKTLDLMYISKSGCLWFGDDEFGLIVYNPKDKGIDVQLPSDFSFWGYNRAVYVESLISPNIAD